ncbi:MAG TPA: ABC transporter ATP-binding protein [Dokdonella sp.]
MSAASAAVADATTAIRLEGVQFSWRGGACLLDIEHLVIARGERVFLQGASGSGKSTLLGLLGGVLLPQRGRIAVLGSDLTGLRGAQRDRFRADHIGFVFQQFNLLPFLSVRENVLLPLRFSARRRRAVLQRGEADAEADRLLRALDLDPARHAHQAVGSLSVGQQQRVAAARALIGDPELLVADEPTSALDADARAAFLHLLFGECRRAATTVVFVSHDRSLAPSFDRSMRLSDINRTARTGPN